MAISPEARQARYSANSPEVTEICWVKGPRVPQMAMETATYSLERVFAFVCIGCSL